MGNEGVTGDEVYQPEADEIREDDGILDPEDTLGDQESDPYDEGWTPPERPLASTRTGITAEEQHEGESLAERLSEERPDPALVVPEPVAGDEVVDGTAQADEPLDEALAVALDDEPLLPPDEGAVEDPEDAAEHDMIGEDMGVEDTGFEDMGVEDGEGVAEAAAAPREPTGPLVP
ncbi:DUF5709 domain-containing protein [Streptomyces sp. DSM 118878]